MTFPISCLILFFYNFYNIAGIDLLLLPMAYVIFFLSVDLHNMKQHM